VISKRILGEAATETFDPEILKLILNAGAKLKHSSNLYCKLAQGPQTILNVIPEMTERTLDLLVLAKIHTEFVSKC
jgi:hypothetical protein